MLRIYIELGRRKQNKYNLNSILLNLVRFGFVFSKSRLIVPPALLNIHTNPIILKFDKRSYYFEENTKLLLLPLPKAINQLL